MKKFILLLILMGPIFGFSQNSPIDELFDKYAEKDGFTTVYISSFMFNLMKSIAQKDNDDDFKNIVSKLEGIKILTMDDKKQAKNVNFYQEIMGKLPKQEYNELMVVKEKGQEFKMFLKEPKDDKSGEFLMIGGGEDNLLISIVGDIDVETLSKLSNSMNLTGMDKLKHVNSKDSTSGK